jgi:hypothetical protein
MVVIAFPGNRFNGDIAPAIDEVVGKGIIRVNDLVFIRKDADGSLRAVELDDMDDDGAHRLDPLADDISGLLSPEDIETVGQALEPNSSAALLLFEHLWAIRVRDAILESGGKLVMQERIPAEAAEQVLHARAASEARP